MRLNPVVHTHTPTEKRNVFSKASSKKSEENGLFFDPSGLAYYLWLGVLSVWVLFD